MIGQCGFGGRVWWDRSFRRTNAVGDDSLRRLSVTRRLSVAAARIYASFYELAWHVRWSAAFDISIDTPCGRVNLILNQRLRGKGFGAEIHDDGADFADGEDWFDGNQLAIFGDGEDGRID